MNLKRYFAKQDSPFFKMGEEIKNRYDISRFLHWLTGDEFCDPPPEWYPEYIGIIKEEKKMNVEDLKNGKFFTTNGKDIWKLESYCLHPTCTLVNLETGKKESFGLGGLTAQGFLKIEMPIVDDREVLNEVQSEN